MQHGLAHCKPIAYNKNKSGIVMRTNERVANLASKAGTKGDIEVACICPPKWLKGILTDWRGELSSFSFCV